MKSSIISAYHQLFAWIITTHVCFLETKNKPNEWFFIGTFYLFQYFIVSSLWECSLYAHAKILRIFTSHCLLSFWQSQIGFEIPTWNWELIKETTSCSSFRSLLITNAHLIIFKMFSGLNSFRLVVDIFLYEKFNSLCNHRPMIDFEIDVSSLHLLLKLDSQLFLCQWYSCFLLNI